MGEKGFRPTSTRLHRKSGKCALCGEFMPLTLAHVPPRAAFNDGAGSLGGVDGDDALAYGRPRTGGLRIPAHCESCRAQTSPWDDEYIPWAREFAGILVQSEWKGQRTEVSGKLRNVRPGRFIRAALAGMTALAPNLIDTHPALDRRGSGGAPGAQAHRRVIHRHDRERTRGISHLCSARALPSRCN